jgi:hypothetical protein
MSAIIGIDPGRTGYIAAVDSDGVVWSEPMPDTPERIASIVGCRDASPAFVERQHAMHGQGVSSTFTTAFGYGQIVGVLAGLGMRYALVRACDWQKAMLRGEPKAKGKELKALYVAVAERTWPSISFRGPRGGLLDGKAAACLIAEYGRRLLLGA